MPTFTGTYECTDRHELLKVANRANRIQKGAG
jgi:hypothetical protein